MARRSAIRTVLDRMSKRDLQDFLDHQDLPTSGTKDALLERLVGYHQRDLEDLMSRGPWKLTAWNDFAEGEFGCDRAKSYADLAEALTLAVSPEAQKFREFWDSLEGITVADVRDYPGAFDGPWLVPAVRRVLESAHGRTLVQNLLGEVFEALDSSDKDDDDDDDDDDDTDGSARWATKSTSDSSSAESSARSGTSSAAPDVPMGATLADSYSVVKKLGEGGFGAAYEVESHLPRRTLVAKLATPGNRRSLENEYAKIRLVDHPNVCRVYELARDRKWGPVLVVQHGGRALASIARKGIPAADAVRIASDAARGLDHLHSLGIIHGDVNPGNILVDAHDVVRLADFGLSGFLTQAATSAGVSREATTLRGRHTYFSSFEVLAGRPPSARSDQSSLALVFLWMLVGDPRFGVDQRAGLAGRPSAIRYAIDRALHSDPGARFGSCAEFTQDLARGIR